MPSSGSSFFINLSGGMIFLLWMMAVPATAQTRFDVFLPLGAVVAFLWIAALEIILLRVHRRPHVGWRGEDAPPPDGEQIAVKLAAFVFCIALFVWFCIGMDIVLGERGVAYGLFFGLLKRVLLPVLLAGGAYISCVNARLGNPRDGLWHLGALLLGKPGAEPRAAWGYVKSLLLRFFFIPMLFLSVVSFYQGALSGGRLSFLADDLPVAGGEIFKPFLAVYLIFSVIDVFFAFIGYVGVFRALDTDIRTTEPTPTGWIVCLICYPPFFDAVFKTWLLSAFYTNHKWFYWLADAPQPLIFVWGALTIICMCLESFSTLTFGIRFSNLTYRGLVNDGLYRWTRHPQYVAKMFNRFMVYVPFLSAGGVKDVPVNLAQFGGLAFLYFLRARTEENHLARYPEYAAYAREIDEKGIFRFLNRALPFLTFREERRLAGRIF